MSFFIKREAYNKLPPVVDITVDCWAKPGGAHVLFERCKAGLRVTVTEGVDESAIVISEGNWEKILPALIEMMKQRAPDY